MRAIDAHTRDRLGTQGALTALALRIFRGDGAVLGLTDHDRDLDFAGTLFRAAPGMRVGPLELTADLAPDNAVIETAFCEEGLRRNDLEAGRYAEAHAELWRVDCEDSAARLLLSAGTIGEIVAEGEKLTLEFRGVTHRLATITGRSYQKSCDAALGDARCGVDLVGAAFSARAVVAENDGVSLAVMTGTSFPDRHFASGTAEVMGGELRGAKRAIRTERRTGEGLSLILWEPFSKTLPPGTDLLLTAGCDKSFQTCRAKFSNGTNFGGFPTIPGMGVLAVKSKEGA